MATLAECIDLYHARQAAKAAQAPATSSIVLPWEQPPATPEFGALIRQHRLAAAGTRRGSGLAPAGSGMSTHALARRVHVRQGYLSQIEAGKRRPSWYLVLEIAAVLNLTDAQRDELYEAVGYAIRAREAS